MKINKAEFVAAADRPAAVPKAQLPEVAMAGRSNVGKSSLINHLTGRKKLARTSQTPGCTRGLIFFNINDKVGLVDLPGYGWAKRSHGERDSWQRLVEAYLSERDALCGVLILVDVRRGPEEEEAALADFLDAHGVPFAWVLTKCDKLSRPKLRTRIAQLDKQFGGSLAIATSSQAGVGRDLVWKWIMQAAADGRKG